MHWRSAAALVLLAGVSLGAACGGASIFDGSRSPPPSPPPPGPVDTPYVCTVQITNRTDHTYLGYSGSCDAGELDPPLAPMETRDVLFEGSARCPQAGSCTWDLSFRFHEIGSGRPSAWYHLEVEEPCTGHAVTLTGSWVTYECLQAYVNETDQEFVSCSWDASDWSESPISGSHAFDPPLGPGEETELLVTLETFYGGPEDVHGRTHAELWFQPSRDSGREDVPEVLNVAMCTPVIRPIGDTTSQSTGH